MLRINTAGYSEITNISEIKKHISFNTWLLLDLDNTVMEAIRELGSDQWFVKLIEHACRTCPENTKEAIEWVISIYTAVQHHIKTIVVEQDIVELIKALQDIGVPVIGITARDHSLVDTTFRQLRENNIDFGRNRETHEYYIDIGGTKNKIVYHNGIIFCSGNNKDIALEAFFAVCDILPQHIVMVDDKGKHLEHVEKFLQKLNISFVGCRYGFLDEKIKLINMEEAHLQLAHIKKHLPTEIQSLIDKLKVPNQNMQIDPNKYNQYFVTNPKRTREEKSDTPNESKNELNFTAYETGRPSSSLSIFAPKRRKITPMILKPKPTHRHTI